MRTFEVHLKSISQYSQSKYKDPRLDPMREGESQDAYEERTWRDRMHTTAEGKVFMPPLPFKLALAETARLLQLKVPGKKGQTWNAHFLKGIQPINGLTLPVKKEDVVGEAYFVPSDGKKGGTTRVRRIFPMIPFWEGKVSFLITDDEITEDIFRTVVEKAGILNGVGRYTPRVGGSYGMWRIEGIKVVNMK